MQRVLSLLFIAVLMLSHGSMSGAALHAPVSHGPAAANISDHHDHDAEEGHSSLRSAAAADSQSDGGDPHMGAGFHVHVVCDRVSPIEIVVMNRLARNDAQRLQNTHAPPSAEQQPLLEPPSS